MKNNKLSPREREIRNILLKIAKIAKKSDNSVVKRDTKNVYAYQFTDLEVKIFEREENNEKK